MEGGDIAVDPFEGQSLVLSSPVAGRIIFGARAQMVGTQPPKYVDTVLDCYHDHVRKVAQRASIKLGVVRATVRLKRQRASAEASL